MMSKTRPSGRQQSPRQRWGRRLCKIVLVFLVVLSLVSAGYLWCRHTAASSLQETVAELDQQEPGWHWAELQSARAAIPEEENAATQVAVVAGLVPRSWPSL